MPPANTADLKPGDVLLYRDDGLLARAIRLFDGTEVHHAGVYVGNDVAEALGEGVIKRPLAKSIAGREWVMFRRLKEGGVSMDPVLGRADVIVTEGPRYAYEQLLLLAFLAITRKPKITPILRFLLRKLLDAAAAALAKLIATTTGAREPMICSEFVFRCYDEALPSAVDPYTLQINQLPVIAATSAIASVVPVRGRGVNPESLLAWAASSPATASAVSWARPRPQAAVAAAPPVVSDQELEALLQTYLQEVKSDGQSAIPSAQTVTDEELRDAVERFADAWFEATTGKSPAAIATASVGGVSSPFQHLFRTAADFVTPGDLLNTESLFTVGKLVP